MDRPVEERKPGREGGRQDRVVEGRENRLARASALEEEDDFGCREEDRPAVDGVGDDRVATVGEKLLCVFALSPAFRRATRTTRSTALTSGSLGV